MVTSFPSVPTLIACLACVTQTHACLLAQSLWRSSFQCVPVSHAGGGVPPPYLVYLPFFPTTLFSLFALFLSLSFLLNNSPNLDPGSHSSRLFSFPPDYGSCLGRHFYRERTSAVVDSHPFALNQHMCIRTLGAFFGCFVWQRTWMSTWRPATRRSSTTCTRLCPRRKKTSKTSR